MRKEEMHGRRHGRREGCMEGGGEAKMEDERRVGEYWRK